ncbi:hypothetical protein C8N46_108131 [Kordia periserrulae]|uniref:CRISPR/Cas system CSM-associated protein Csm3 (Group 7 of RAMP superfamily) n=1 Tax=Kordia periserrulae TaxID=701523 RepID=A0A2T6BUR7_9FLAO|nr:hypothetical protein [Kordia periserrulae]PTX59818.1 hypothetical protein C8N46_108131 [Kordia periserrulae]
MNILSYSVTFHSYWLHQDKAGQSVGVDNSPILEDDHPIFGGKALKGLFKEQIAVLQYCKALSTADERLEKLFGKKYIQESDIKFNSVRLKEFVPKNYHHLFFKDITTTAIEAETKQAKEHSLRTTKVVIPMRLEGTITIENMTNETVLENLKKDLHLMAGLIKEIGKDRYKGLGSCVVKIEETCNIIL